LIFIIKRIEKMQIWKKNLYIIWVTQFLAVGGINMVLPFLPFFIRQLGVSSMEQERIWSGWAYAGPFLLSFLTTPLWGSLGDKYGRKFMAVRAMFGLGISQILVGFAQSPFQLVFFRMIQGVVSGFIPAAIALVAANTPKENTSYSLGVLQTSLASGSIIGPLIGGALSDIMGYRYIFFINAGTCILMGFFLMKGFQEIAVNKEEEKHFKIIDNYKFIFSRKHLLGSVIIIFFTQTALMMNGPIFALFVESMLKNNNHIAMITGFLFGIAGIANVITAPLWGKKNDKEGASGKTLFIVLNLAGISLFMHAFVNQPYQVLVLRFMLGVAIGGILPTLYSIMSHSTPLERRGGVLGISSSFTVLGNMIGPLVGGYLASLGNFNFVFFSSGAVVFFCAIFITRSLNNISE
jgi:MFS transporter, DHA1 family, multidrug resistance protein